MYGVYLFFFFKQKPAYEVRISYWSSDVCSSDLDASDYLQYSTTSANATYHLLAAYRDFPSVFEDDKQANGLKGSNGLADVLDEAKWGLDWLLKIDRKSVV